jgi:hypothetical protein
MTDDRERFLEVLQGIIRVEREKEQERMAAHLDRHGWHTAAQEIRKLSQAEK